MGIGELPAHAGSGMHPVQQLAGALGRACGGRRVSGVHGGASNPSWVIASRLEGVPRTIMPACTPASCLSWLATDMRNTESKYASGTTETGFMPRRSRYIQPTTLTT